MGEIVKLRQVTVEHDENHNHLEVVDVTMGSYGSEAEGTVFLCMMLVGADGKEIGVHIDARMAIKLAKGLLSSLDSDCVEFLDDFKD